MVGTTSKKQKLSPGVEANVKACQNVLKALKKSHVSAPFAVPVDWKALNLPLYPKMIKHPMDLGTIEKKLLAGRHARCRSRRRATRRLPRNHALRRPAFSPARPPLRRPRSVRLSRRSIPVHKQPLSLCTKGTLPSPTLRQTSRSCGTMRRPSTRTGVRSTTRRRSCVSCPTRSCRASPLAR